MRLEVINQRHCKIIKISGRIDSYTAPEIGKQINAEFDHGHHNIIIDLQAVTYLSSSGILTFVEAQRELNRQNAGCLVFTNVPDIILSNFKLAGFYTIFIFYHDTIAAVNHFQEYPIAISRLFRASYKNLADISEFVVSQAESAGFSPGEIYAIQTAVDEASSNIIDHAYGAEDIGDIEITLQQNQDQLKILLVDQGEPFEPDQVLEPDITSPLEVRKERGLGIFFMRKLMDQVDFEFSQEKGNMLTLIKNKRS